MRSWVKSIILTALVVMILYGVSFFLQKYEGMTIGDLLVHAMTMDGTAQPSVYEPEQSGESATIRHADGTQEEVFIRSK